MSEKTVDKMIFANRLRELIKASGLTTKELGEKLGLSNASVSRYQSGELLPKKLTLMALSKFFDVEPDWLLGLSDEKSPNKLERALSTFAVHLAEKEITDEKINLVTQYIDLVFRDF